MISARQHIPNFVSGFDSETVAAPTVAEVLQGPFLKHWAAGGGFSHWEYGQGYATDDEDFLMAIMQDGKFWVAAYVSPKGALAEHGLTEWRAPK